VQVPGSTDYDCDSPAYVLSGKSIRKDDKKQITKRNKVHCTLYKMKNAINSISKKKILGVSTGGSRKRKTTRRKKNTRRR
jgi:hypothetical protein